MHERCDQDRRLPEPVVVRVSGPAAPQGHRLGTNPSIAPDRVSRAVGSPQPPRRGNGHRAPARARGPGEGQQTVS
jgi:hypothetical protein